MQLSVPYKDYTSNTTTLLQGLPIQLGTYRNYLHVPTIKRFMQISLQGLYNYYYKETTFKLLNNYLR